LACCKLVRDGLVGRVGGVVYRVDGVVLERLLRVKVVEEALEFAVSGDLGEAADLLEALLEWLRLRGVGVGVVAELMRRKRAERGGFGGGWVVCFDGVC